MIKAPPLFHVVAVRKEFIFADLRLREKRKKLGISMLKVATAAKITKMYYSEIERGKKSCSPEVAKRISEVFTNE